VGKLIEEKLELDHSREGKKSLWESLPTPQEENRRLRRYHKRLQKNGEQGRDGWGGKPAKGLPKKRQGKQLGNSQK